MEIEMENKIKTKILENFMKDNQLSKTQFCKLCKISPSTFQKIMTNNFHFKISALFKIAKVINIQVFQMFE